MLTHISKYIYSKKSNDSLTYLSKNRPIRKKSNGLFTMWFTGHWYKALTMLIGFSVCLICVIKFYYVSRGQILTVLICCCICLTCCSWVTLSLYQVFTRHCAHGREYRLNRLDGADEWVKTGICETSSSIRKTQLRHTAGKTIRRLNKKTVTVQDAHGEASWNLDGLER